MDYDVYEVNTRRARIEHQCVECRLTIYPGETYHTHAGLCDGSWRNWKVCDSCQGWAALVSYDPDEGYIIGDLHIALSEEYGHNTYPLRPGQQVSYYAPAYKLSEGET